jgi:hypothetical protein
MMRRYNICNRLATGEVLYLGSHQQWVNDVTQAIILHGTGVPDQKVSDNTDTLGVLGVSLVPMADKTSHAQTALSVVPTMYLRKRSSDVGVARQA